MTRHKLTITPADSAAARAAASRPQKKSAPSSVVLVPVGNKKKKAAAAEEEEAAAASEEEEVADEEPKKKKKKKERTAAAAAASDGEEEEESKDKEKKKKKKKAAPAKKRGAAAAAAAADSDEEEEEDDQAVIAEEEEEDATFDIDEEEEEEEKAPIAHRLVVPSSAAAGAAVGRPSSSRRRLRKIMFKDAREARAQSGLFGSSVPRTSTHHSSFKNFLSELIDTDVRPRMAKGAIVCMQRNMEVVARTIILPGACDALLVSHAFATEKARDDARLKRSIQDRHMEASVTTFCRRLNPSLQPLLQANLLIVREMEAAKAAKRRAHEAVRAHLVSLKTAIDKLQEQEKEYIRDPNSLLGALTDKQRADLIAHTIEYDTANLASAKKKALKLDAAIQNADAFITETETVTIPETVIAIKELEGAGVAAIKVLLQAQKEAIEKQDAALTAFKEANKDKLEEAANTRAKFTDAQKALRKQQRDLETACSTKRTAQKALRGRLAALRRQVKKKTKRIESLKAKVPLKKKAIATNKVLLLEARLVVKNWQSALNRSKVVRKQESEMDETD